MATHWFNRRGKRPPLHPANWLYFGVLVELQAAWLYLFQPESWEAWLHYLGTVTALLLAALGVSVAAFAAKKSAAVANLAFAGTLTLGQVGVVNEIRGIAAASGEAPEAPSAVPAMAYGETETSPLTGSAQWTGPTDAAEGSPAIALAHPPPAADPLLEELLARQARSHFLLQQRLHEAGYYDPGSIRHWEDLAARMRLVEDFIRANKEYLQLCREATLTLQADQVDAYPANTRALHILDATARIRELDLRQGELMLRALFMLGEHWGEWSYEPIQGQIAFEDPRAQPEYEAVTEAIAALGATQLEAAGALARRDLLR